MGLWVFLAKESQEVGHFGFRPSNGALGDAPKKKKKNIRSKMPLVATIILNSGRFAGFSAPRRN